MKPANIYFSFTLSVVFIFLIEIASARVVFEFRRYHYKKKPRVEIIFKKEYYRCETTVECHPLSGLEKTRCVRICLAPDCYYELYGHDELEEGEIDIRSSSYKGCWFKHYKKPVNKIDT